jgi:hypothetical protein
MGLYVLFLRTEERFMTATRDKAKEKIQDVADAAKKAADAAVEHGKDLAHKTGKKLNEAGKRLQSI